MMKLLLALIFVAGTALGQYQNNNVNINTNNNGDGVQKIEFEPIIVYGEIEQSCYDNCCERFEGTFEDDEAELVDFICKKRCEKPEPTEPEPCDNDFCLKIDNSNVNKNSNENSR